MLEFGPGEWGGVGWGGRERGGENVCGSVYGRGGVCERDLYGNEMYEIYDYLSMIV